MATELSEQYNYRDVLQETRDHDAIYIAETIMLRLTGAWLYLKITRIFITRERIM